MLGLGVGFYKLAGNDYLEVSDWPGAEGFLNLDGSDDFGSLSLTSTIREQLSGSADTTDDIQNNITISMWVKPTWTFDPSGANFIGFFVLGDDTNVHEGIRLYHSLELGNGTFTNRLTAEARSATGGNKKQTDYAVLNSGNASISGCGTGTTDNDMWDVDNEGNLTGDGFVNLVWTRGTGTANWKIYWNGSALTMSDSGADSLSTDESTYDVIEIGKFSHASNFHQYGIRDLAIFNAELNSSQVTELYNSGDFFDVRTASTVDDLVFYCPLNDTGIELINGNDLTITGGTFTAISGGGG